MEDTKSDRKAGKYKKGRGGKKKGNRDNGGGPKGIPQNYELSKQLRQNDAFFKYCKLQQVVPEEEFQLFEDILKVDLPASFRIQRSLPEREEFENFLEKQFFQPLRELNDSEIHCPEKIPFIPLAYQTNNTRFAIRSSPILSELHQVLISETTNGNISRQEAVSMVPPLLLDIQPHHFVLDACAAPGSKTMQITELMHLTDNNPEGLLVANDASNDRCYLLVHQTLKRLPTANCIVLNHDAGNLPAPLDAQGNISYFDRILCDVICTGDGTFRKNIELWKSWTAKKGLDLHKLQKTIANRCVELLKVGGLMAYSTCSLNPMEDEAVLAHLLRTHKGALELVDVSHEMPELKRSPGKSDWKVLSSKLVEYPTYEDSQKVEDRSIAASMFPPTPEEAEEFNLHRSFRILPHAQNSGGFFVAILRKTAAPDTKISVNMAPYRPAPAKKRKTVKEDPFVFMSADKDAEFKEEINTVYGIGDSFPFENLLTRNLTETNRRAIYFVNNALRDFIKYNSDRFHIVNAGVNILRKVEKVGISNYRVTQDGLAASFPHIKKRVIELDMEDMKKVLTGSHGNHFISLDDLKAKDKFMKLSAGSIILQIKHSNFSKEIVAWMGALTVTAFVTREEKIHLLNILGCDASALKLLVQTTRREKAQKLRDAAAKKEDSDAEQENGDVKMEDVKQEDVKQEDVKQESIKEEVKIE